MNKLMAIIAETYTSQVKSKSFILMLLLPFIFILFSGGIGFIAGSGAADAGNNQVAVVGDSQVRKIVIKQTDDSVDASIKTEKQAKHHLKNDDIDGYVKITEENGQFKADYMGNTALDGDVKDDIMRALSTIQGQLNIHNSNLSKQQLKTLSVQPTYASHVKNDKYNDPTKFISLYSLILVLYLFLLMYSGITASVIAKEKGSKITEIIFSSTSSINYFLGKIIGVVLMMLTQMAVYILVIGLGYQSLKQMAFMKGFMQNGGQSVISGVLKNFVNINAVFIIVGLIIGIIASAMCGALVTKREDASKAAQPVMMITMLLFFASFALQSNSNAIVAKVLSYIPVASSFLMPIRIINNQVNGIEIAISLVITIAFTIFVTYWIGKQYKGLMLQTGDRGWFRNLISGLKYH